MVMLVWSGDKGVKFIGVLVWSGDDWGRQISSQ